MNRAVIAWALITTARIAATDTEPTIKLGPLIELHNGGRALA